MSSFKYNNVYIKDYETICGPKEKEGKIRFSNSIKDYYNGQEGIEEAEIKMQEFCISKIIRRNNIGNIELLVGGDLMNQIAITSYNIANKNIPFLGIYNACASFNESLIILANSIESKLIKEGLSVTSSHNLNSERQFRYPVEYGCPKKCYTTTTTTGAVCCLLTNEKTNIKIESATVGTVVDYGIKDANNMGAVMSPGAVKTLLKHLKEMNRDIDYYDLIVTGDLGELGEKIFLKLLKDESGLKPKNYFDAATQIYRKSSEMCQGGSGPVVVPLVLFNKILKEDYKRILVLATGSLHNPVMVNLKKSIPTICHAISIEVKK